MQDPAHINAEAGNVAGDNDPVDVVEIGSAAHPTGAVVPIKALGVFAMIDDGELDWKVIGIAASDPAAASLNDVADVERVFPGVLEKIRVWFRDYKTPDGKPQNAFGYNDKCLVRRGVGKGGREQSARMRADARLASLPGDARRMPSSRRASLRRRTASTRR